MRRYADKAKELSECELMVKPLTLDVKGGERSGESGVTYEGSRVLRSDLLVMFRPLYFSGQRDAARIVSVVWSFAVGGVSIAGFSIAVID